MSNTKEKNYQKVPGIYGTGKALTSGIFKSYYRPIIIGKENIPTSGRAIIAGDHIHLYDQCHAIISTKRPIFYMAKKEYFDNKKISWFFEGAGCIPVDRSKKDESATASALDVLNHDGLLGIFPEGTRNHSKDEKIKEIYDQYFSNLKYDDILNTLRDKNVKLSQVNFLLSLFDQERIDKKHLDKYIFHVDGTLRIMLNEGEITEDEYYESLLLPFKFGAVSMAQKSNSPIVPMVITGEYKHHGDNLIVSFGVPYVVGDKDLAVANKELRDIFIDLIKRNEKTANDLKVNKELKKEMKKNK